MKARLAILALYAVLGTIALLFLFPFYWVAMSSLKSRQGMSMIPPAYYPCEPGTADLTVQTAGRIITAEGNHWVRLSSITDGGAYYARLEGSKAGDFLRFFADGEGLPSKAPEIVTFKEAPLLRVQGRAETVVQAGRMVRQNGSKTDETIFVLQKGATNLLACETIVEPVYQQVRIASMRWRNFTETLRGPESTFSAKSEGGFLLFLRNSFFISIMAVLGQVCSSSLVAFGFTRLHFRGRDTLFVVLLATLMVPAQVTLIPLFTVYKTLGWVDSFLPLIVPHFTAGAFNVFLLRQYMLTLPKELDEAAAVDGCSAWQTYWRVILPNCTPVLIVVGIFTFVGTWEDVMGPLIYLDNPAYRTVTLGLEYFRSPYVDNRHLLMTGALLAMLPVAAVFLFLQRYIMAGIATTGIKG